MAHVSIDYLDARPTVDALTAVFGPEAREVCRGDGDLMRLGVLKRDGARVGLDPDLHAWLLDGVPREAAAAAPYRLGDPETGLPVDRAIQHSLEGALEAVKAGGIVHVTGGDLPSIQASLAKTTGRPVVSLALEPPPDKSPAIDPGPILAAACREAALREGTLFVSLRPWGKAYEALGRLATDRVIVVHGADALSGLFGRAPLAEADGQGDQATLRNKALVRALPRQLLLPDPDEVRAALRGLAVPPDRVMAAAREAATEALLDVPGGRPVRGDVTLSSPGLVRALRGQMTTRLGDHAEVLSLMHAWGDLELDDDQEDQLREVLAAWRHRSTVLEDWGFGSERGRGLGLTVLLYGPPGTGKTMAASVLAAELDLQLFRIDLSRVVDKYIGETEKALANVFDEAEKGEVLLLFDEADSLFGQRTSVSSSTDRYANLEVNFLLQRIESYRGITVLTTNHEQLMDDAFKRRLSHRVHFPMPDADHRAHIWRRLIPDAAPVGDDVDYEELGERFEMSGGHIKNAVLTAAVRAAMDDTAIGMRHFVEGGNREYGTLGKVVRDYTE